MVQEVHLQLATIASVHNRTHKCGFVVFTRMNHVNIGGRRYYLDDQVVICCSEIKEGIT